MSNYLKTTVLLAALSALLLLIGQAVGGQAGMIVAFVFAAIMNFGSYWFSDRLVLTMYRGRPVGPDHRLYRIVERLCQRANLPMPKVYVLPTPSPNAFATGRSPSHASVAATEGLLAILDDEELEGVMGHELAHVAHRDILIQSVAATIGAAIMLLANMARWAAIFGVGGRDDRDGGSPLALLATALLAPIAAMIIQAAISRSREFEADSGGARIAGSPAGLARALAKIERAVRQVPLEANPATAHLFIMQPFAGGKGLLGLFSSHPPTEERIRRLMRIG
ncbi:MAG: protease HtpX [Candidatus Dadabacteria bacterium]|nr:MAG: protease HtpX [Candidatus Dadabacteria bacterium]